MYPGAPGVYWGVPGYVTWWFRSYSGRYSGVYHGVPGYPTWLFWPYSGRYAGDVQLETDLFCKIIQWNTIAVRSILGNSQIYKLGVNTPVARVYLAINRGISSHVACRSVTPLLHATHRAVMEGREPWTASSLVVVAFVWSRTSKSTTYTWSIYVHAYVLKVVLLYETTWLCYRNKVENINWSSPVLPWSPDQCCSSLEWYTTCSMLNFVHASFSRRLSALSSCQWFYYTTNNTRFFHLA